MSEEHELRGRLGRDISATDEHQRLSTIEVELDQCWDLLRQRQAKREAGQDPDEAAARPADTVEGYFG